MEQQQQQQSDSGPVKLEDGVLTSAGLYVARNRDGLWDVFVSVEAFRSPTLRSNPSALVATDLFFADALQAAEEAAR